MLVEYLWGTRSGYAADDITWLREVVPFRILKRTPKRVYYVRRQHPLGDVDLGFVDRNVLERDGEVTRRTDFWSADFRLFADRERAEAHLGLGQPAYGPHDLAALRRAMADAHPDRGGTNAAFIAARIRYQRARALLRGGAE